MTRYTMNQIRKGLKVLEDGEPCVIVETDFRKPGKGQVFVHVKLRGIRSGRVVPRTLKNSDSLQAADLLDVQMKLLYREQDEWHFMNPDTHEQVIADAGAMGDAAGWVKGGEICVVSLWNGVPLLVDAPGFVELTVIEADPGVRGDTSSAGSKPVRLETGAVVRVPLFVMRGETIRVDTRSGDYVARVRAA